MKTHDYIPGKTIHERIGRIKGYIDELREIINIGNLTTSKVAEIELFIYIVEGQVRILKNTKTKLSIVNPSEN